LQLQQPLQSGLRLVLLFRLQQQEVRHGLLQQASQQGLQQGLQLQQEARQLQYLLHQLLLQVPSTGQHQQALQHVVLQWRQQLQHLQRQQPAG
jgi:hypothetical protein